MKKRIISLILVVVMLCLSLVSCGYSYADDDLSAYATFDKAKFDSAIASLVIEDGDFTTDEATRALKVIDDIMATLSGLADKDDKKTAGTPGSNDLFYYSYYMTADAKDKDGNAVADRIFLVSSMASGKEVSSQFGLNFPSDLAKGVLAAFAGFELKEANEETGAVSNTYAPVISGKIEAGQVAYISYTRTYTTTDAEGVESKTTETVTNNRVVISASNPIHEKLIGKDIGTSQTFELTDEANKGSYSAVKVNFVENTGVTVKDVAQEKYDAAEKITDTFGVEYKTADLTNIVYHVYPVAYVDVADINATNIVTLIYKSSLTFDTLKHMLFGHGEGEEFENTVKAELEKLKVTVDDKEVSFEDFVTSLVTKLEDYDSKKEAYDTAKKALDEAQEGKDTAQTEADSAAKKLADAQQAVDDAGDAATEDQKKALEDAKSQNALKATALTTATTKLESAKTDETEAKEALTKATEARDESVKTLVSMADMEKNIVDGYKNHTVYEELQTAYNTTIKTNLAKAVNKLIGECTTLVDKDNNPAPKDAVKEAADRILENYEYSFYENQKVGSDTNHSSTETYYKKFGGSFKEFLVYAVNLEHSSEAKTYDEAIAVIEGIATEYVQEIVNIYVVSKAYDLVISDKEFKDLKDEDANYTYNAENYGENTVRNAYQFDKLMNYILENDEEDGKVTYNKVKFTFEAED